MEKGPVWDPHTGQRIGEASNPGPERDKEMQLASALLAVLQSFKEQVDQRSVHTAMQDQRKDPASKTFEATERATGPQEVSLASRLLSVLQEALFSVGQTARLLKGSVRRCRLGSPPGPLRGRRPHATRPLARSLLVVPGRSRLNPKPKRTKLRPRNNTDLRSSPPLLLLSAPPNGIKPLRSHPSSRCVRPSSKVTSCPGTSWLPKTVVRA